MKAQITVIKSFDDPKNYVKDIVKGDLPKFFSEESDYMETLCNTMNEYGNRGDEFTIVYTVTVRK